MNHKLQVFDFADWACEVFHYPGRADLKSLLNSLQPLELFFNEHVSWNAIDCVSQLTSQISMCYTQVSYSDCHVTLIISLLFVLPSREWVK